MECPCNCYCDCDCHICSCCKGPSRINLGLNVQTNTAVPDMDARTLEKLKRKKEFGRGPCYTYYNERLRKIPRTQYCTV